MPGTYLYFHTINATCTGPRFPLSLKTGAISASKATPVATEIRAMLPDGLTDDRVTETRTLVSPFRHYPVMHAKSDSMRKQNIGCRFACSRDVCSFIVLAFCLLVGCSGQPDGIPAASPAVPEEPQDRPNSEDNQADTLPILTEQHTLPPPRETDMFEDITAAAGFDHHTVSGRAAEHYTMIEGLGSGVALFDYDRDGDLDILCASGGIISAEGEVQGLPCQLYRNNGDFQFVNVTVECGLNIPIDYNHGLAVADVDQDGYPDLFVSCYGKSRLFRNVAGKSFEDVTDRLGIELRGWHTACLFADVNRDGLPDLFVTGYLDWTMENQPHCKDPATRKRDVCLPSEFPAARDFLLLNRGQFQFEQAGREYGIRADGKGLGIIAGDFNHDQRIDVYIANDVTGNFFYKGLAQGGFLEIGTATGLAGNEYGSPEGSMGVTAADVNQDRLIDLFVTNFELEDNSLYLNEGNDLFVHATAKTGLAGACRLLVGFGCLFTDVDADGWDDLVLVNGHLVYRNRISAYQQRPFLFRNERGRFRDVTGNAGPWFQAARSGRGLAAGDLNNDGAIDLVITEQDGPTTILKNRLTPELWWGIELQREQGKSDLTGTVVTWLDREHQISNQVLSGGSYLSHSDQRIRFYPTEGNQPSNTIDVQIQWPDGFQEQFTGLKQNVYQRLLQGTGMSVPEKARE